MADLWGFLLQTLTVSGTAVLLLILRFLFRDKLPPRWHWYIWGILGIVILTPTGWNGRYLLVNWRFYVEVIKGLCGDYSYTQVRFPVPVLQSMPTTWIEWIYAIYVLGVIVHVLFYMLSYVRLRIRIQRGNKVAEAVQEQVRRIAESYQLKRTPVIELSGISSAFVGGIIRPVLVIPEGAVLDDKVILHELLHVRSHDTWWTIVICILRCLHWCNPLVIYCAKQAANDMEACCDQGVLERIDGEERRDYGRILLSMINERYSKTPGSTCLNNGGSNISRRIEAIARFKKYPKGMKLVSVCAFILLACGMVTGVAASEVEIRNSNGSGFWAYDVAAARSTPCVTPDAAFDAYGKAVLAQNGLYRIMCAPEEMQKPLIDEIQQKRQNGIAPEWNGGIPCWPSRQRYYIYNLKCEDDIYEGLLVIKLNYPPDGEPGQEGYMYLAVQNLQVFKENGHWVAVPLDDWVTIEALEQNLEWGCLELPGLNYTGTAENIQVGISTQTIYWTESEVQNNTTYWGEDGYMYDTTPNGDIRWAMGARMQNVRCTHLGTQEERDRISQIGLSAAPVYEGENRTTATVSEYEVNSYENGEPTLKPGWGPEIEMGGDGCTFSPEIETAVPAYYAVELYVNNEYTASMELTLQEDGND